MSKEIIETNKTLSETLKTKLISRKFLVVLACIVLLCFGILSAEVFGLIVASFLAGQAYVDRQ